MKTLLLIITGTCVLSAALVGDFPALANLPVLGPVAVWLAGAGVGEWPARIAAAASDLWTAAVDHGLGSLHLAVLVVGILLARKVVVWILR